MRRERYEGQIDSKEAFGFLNESLKPEHLHLDAEVGEITNVSSDSSAEVADEAFLIFLVDHHLFGCTVGCLERVAEFRSPDQVPFIRNATTLGFCNHYGQVAPLIDLRTLLGLNASTSMLPYTRIVYVREHGILSGLAVSSVSGVCRATPRPAHEGHSHFGNGVVSTPHGVAAILNVSALSAATREDRV